MLFLSGCWIINYTEDCYFPKKDLENGECGNIKLNKGRRDVNIAHKLAITALGTIMATAALADFPMDKDITFVIPYKPGGGFDTIVRTFEPALEAALGGASVVPENIDGASGNRGGQTVFRADPDGYTIGIYNVPGVTISKVTNRDIGYDLDQVTWIANLAEDRYAVAVKSDSSITSLAELCALGRPIKLSDTGLDSTSSIASVIGFKIMDCPVSLITGYGGSNDTMIAVMRGEVDATLKPIGSLSKYVESGDLRIIATLSDEEILAGVPTTTELGFPDLAKFTINRVIGVPPGVPADIVAKLAEALRNAQGDENVKSWAKKAKTDLTFKDAAQTAEMMNNLSEFYANYKEMLVTK